MNKIDKLTAEREYLIERIDVMDCDHIDVLFAKLKEKNSDWKLDVRRSAKINDEDLANMAAEGW